MQIQPAVDWGIVTVPQPVSTSNTSMETSIRRVLNHITHIATWRSRDPLHPREMFRGRVWRCAYKDPDIASRKRLTSE